MKQLLSRRYSSEGHIRPFVVIVPDPASCFRLYLLNGCKNVLVEPVISDRPIKALDVGILLWLSWLNVAELYALFFSPCD